MRHRHGYNARRMVLLLLSLVLLALGPLVYGLVPRRGVALTALDGFVIAVTAVLVLMKVIPDAVGEGGWTALLFCLAGLLGPTILEKLFHRALHATHLLTLALALIGLSFHALLDGTALSNRGAFHDHALPTAVLFHRFPVGLTIWWLLRPVYGAGAAVAVLVLIGAGTVVGFTFGGSWVAELPTARVAWFEALVAGSLLHVVFHRHPHGDDAH